MNKNKQEGKLDIIEKIDLIDELLNDDIELNSFIIDIEAEERRHMIIKRQIETRNFFRLAVASVIAVVMWQTFLFDNSIKINNQIEQNIEKIKILEGGNKL